MTRVVLTYGTFDLFHVGHLNILKRLKEYGDQLIVGVSTDQFNSEKGKTTVVRFEDRAEIVGNISCVDLVIPENDWTQKIADIEKYNVNIFGMGDDWKGKFDDLSNHCEVLYIPRTDNVSSTDMKRLLKILDRNHISELKAAVDVISGIIGTFDR